MFQCQECHRQFRTVRAAEKAAWSGCPGCGGTDIDLAPDEPPELPLAAYCEVGEEGPDPDQADAA